MNNGDLPGGMYMIGGDWRSTYVLLNRPLPWQKEEPWQRSEDETVMMVPYKRNGKKVTSPYKVKYNGRYYRVYFERDRADINEWYRTIGMPLSMTGRLYILPKGKRAYLSEVCHEFQRIMNSGPPQSRLEYQRIMNNE